MNLLCFIIMKLKKSQLTLIVIDKKNKMQSIKLKEINSTLSEFIKIVLKEQ